MEIPMGAIGEVIEQVGKVALRKEMKKQAKEHPTTDAITIETIARDHLKKDNGFYGHSVASNKQDCFYSNVGNKTGKGRA